MLHNLDVFNTAASYAIFTSQVPSYVLVFMLNFLVAFFSFVVVATTV